MVVVVGGEECGGVEVKWRSWREGKQFTASGSGNLETREFDFGGNFSVGS
jgi:hypothetical protein